MKIFLNFIFPKKWIVFANWQGCQANGSTVNGISGIISQASKQTANNSILNIAQKLKSAFDILKNTTKLQTYFDVNDLSDRSEKVFIIYNPSGL